MSVEKRPGGPLGEEHLFEQKVHHEDGKDKVVGFHGPDGKFYKLEEGEELVHVKREDGSGRDTFIRRDIPFEEWKKTRE